MQGIMAASIAPLLSGITLGMAGFRNLPARLGRNEAWNHAGNASTALAAGILGYFWGITAAFAVMAVMGILAIYCVLHIRPGHIHILSARGSAQPPAEAEYRSPLTQTAYKGNPALLCFGLILLTTWFQYNGTYFTTYKESGIRRLALAERLRKLPLSFFGKRDLADLTSTIMSDCEVLEKTCSHFIPGLFGSLISTVIIALSLFAFDWRMALAALWVIPVSAGNVVGSYRVQD